MFFSWVLSRHCNKVFPMKTILILSDLWAYTDRNVNLIKQSNGHVFAGLCSDKSRNFIIREQIKPEIWFSRSSVQFYWPSASSRIYGILTNITPRKAIHLVIAIMQTRARWHFSSVKQIVQIFIDLHPCGRDGWNEKFYWKHSLQRFKSLTTYI